MLLNRSDQESLGMGRKRRRNAEKRTRKHADRQLAAEATRYASIDEAMAAIEAALERYLGSGSEPWAMSVPDHFSFRRWAHQRFDPRPELNFGAFSTPHRSLPDASPYQFVPAVAFVTARYRRLFKETVASAAEFAKLKLLEGLLSDFEGRPREVIEAMISRGVSPPSVELDPESLSQAEIRLELYAALRDGRDRRAFLLLGALKRGSHDKGELAYLRALAYSKSQVAEDLREAVHLLESLGPDDVDYPKAQALLAEILALQGDTEKVAGKISELAGAASPIKLSAHYVLYLLSLALLNDPSPAAGPIQLAVQNLSNLNDPDREARGDNASAALFVRHVVTVTVECWLRRRERREQLQLLPGVGVAHDPEESSGHDSAELRDSQLEMALSFFPPAEEVSALDSPEAVSVCIDRWLLSGQLYQPDFADFILAIRAKWQLGDRAAFLRVVVTNLESLAQYDLPETWELIGLAYQEAAAVGSTDAERFRSILVRRPGLTAAELELMDSSAATRAVTGGLSPMGRRSYAAADWMLSTAQRMGLGWHDAGLISLGFFRIIELEINERLIKPIIERAGPSEFFLELSRRLADLESLVTHAEPPAKSDLEATDTWRRLESSLTAMREGRTTGLELGLLERVLGKARRVRGKDGSIRELVRNQLLQQLSPLGNRALDSGELARMISQEARERFRNPPAHTRFLPLRTAEECKAYVDEALGNLNLWLPRAEATRTHEGQRH